MSHNVIIMLNRIYKTVAYTTLFVATAQQRDELRLYITLLSILSNIIYVMPKSTRTAYRCDNLVL